MSDDQWTLPLNVSIPWLVELTTTGRPPAPTDPSINPSTARPIEPTPPPTTTRRPPEPTKRTVRPTFPPTTTPSASPPTNWPLTTTTINSTWPPPITTSTTETPAVVPKDLTMTYILIGTGAGIVVLLAILILVWRFGSQRTHVIYSRSRTGSQASLPSAQTKRSEIDATMPTSSVMTQKSSGQSVLVARKSVSPRGKSISPTMSRKSLAKKSVSPRRPSSKKSSMSPQGAKSVLKKSVSSPGVPPVGGSPKRTTNKSKHGSKYGQSPRGK